MKWPENHFIPAELRHAELRGIHANCARCQVMATAVANDMFKCNGCQVVKHILAYSAICCRQFIQGDRRAHIWRCTDCQFPKCKLCDARPEMPVSHNHVEADGSWYCLMHRYPPCHVCRVTPRPAWAMHSKLKFSDWTCSKCKGENSTCADGRSSKPAPGMQPSTDTVAVMHNSVNKERDDGMHSQQEGQLTNQASVQGRSGVKAKPATVSSSPPATIGSHAGHTSSKTLQKQHECSECKIWKTNTEFRKSLKCKHQRLKKNRFMDLRYLHYQEKILIRHRNRVQLYTYAHERDGQI